MIQTRGFEEEEFLGNGFRGVSGTSNVMVAQILAAHGIAVVQVGEIRSAVFTPTEGLVNLPGYIALIDMLAGSGLVDRSRVGISAFSRSGISLLQAIVTRPDLFAAAVDYDSYLPSYVQYLLDADKPQEQNRGRLVGAEPFGAGLPTWLQISPMFNLDKVQTPLKISAGRSFYSLLCMWELYASLRLQNKPVELIWHPDAYHQIRKPWERRSSMQGTVDWYRFWFNGEIDNIPEKKDQYQRWRELRVLRDRNDPKVPVSN